MDEYWVSKVLNSLTSMSNEDFKTLLHKKLFMKNWYNSINTFSILTIFACTFLVFWYFWHVFICYLLLKS